MTPQERQMIDDLFDRLGKVETAPRDPDASAAITDGLRKAPNAVYALVQTVLVQDEALKRANTRIQELEAAQAPHQQQPAGFLDSMRETLFGSSSQPHGSVPNVAPPQSHPVWNSGQVMNQAQSPGYAPPPYGQPASGPSYAGSMFGGGGSFLGTAAAAAAGMVGGSLMLNSIRSMMGGPQHGFGNPAAFGGVAGTPGASPWSDQSNSELARNAGINDIGSSPTDNSDSPRSGLLDQTSNDQSNDQDDQTSNDGDDDMNADDNNFGDDDGDSGNDDGGSDFA
ncbi:MAG: DUF2076 domain-containing protein [Bradyrhizobium sp.]